MTFLIELFELLQSQFDFMCSTRIMSTIQSSKIKLTNALRKELLLKFIRSLSTDVH